MPKKREDYGPADYWAEGQIIGAVVFLAVVIFFVAWHFVAKLLA